MYKSNEIDVNEKNRILKEQIEFLKHERERIQVKFQFKVPTYIIDEIIESKNRHRENNINALINLAKINNRISEEHAIVLKNEFVFHNTSEI